MVSGPLLHARVSGLAQLQKRLRALGASAQDMRDVNNRVGRLVQVEAQRLAPVRTGRLRNSIISRSQKGQVIVEVPRALGVYPFVQEYGWPGHNIRARNYMSGALRNKSDEVRAAYRAEVNRLVRRG